MASIVPRFDDGDAITCYAQTAITGGKFVKIAGAALSDNSYQVVQAAAGDITLGVAGTDAPAGAYVLVYCDGVVPCLAGAAITAGAAVQSDATGSAIPLATGARAGQCLSGAASGAYADLHLTR